MCYHSDPTAYINLSLPKFIFELLTDCMNKTDSERAEIIELVPLLLNSALKALKFDECKEKLADDLHSPKFDPAYWIFTHRNEFDLDEVETFQAFATHFLAIQRSDKVSLKKREAQNAETIFTHWIRGALIGQIETEQLHYHFFQVIDSVEKTEKFGPNGGEEEELTENTLFVFCHMASYLSWRKRAKLVKGVMMDFGMELVREIGKYSSKGKKSFEYFSVFLLRLF